MDTRSMGKKCCCMEGFCRKLIDESDCMKSGGKVVENCSECK